MSNIENPVGKRDDVICNLECDNNDYITFVMPDGYEYTNVDSINYASITMQYIGS